MGHARHDPATEQQNICIHARLPMTVEPNPQVAAAHSAEHLCRHLPALLHYHKSNPDYRRGLSAATRTLSLNWFSHACLITS